MRTAGLRMEDGRMTNLLARIKCTAFFLRITPMGMETGHFFDILQNNHKCQDRGVFLLNIARQCKILLC
jgi:hypothetical protein